MVEARFDDLSAGPSGCFRFTSLIDTVQATTPEEVAGALRSVEDATRAGGWAAGFISYDAAPGLDPYLRVRPRSATDPFAELPLVWFGIFGGWEELDRAAEAPHPDLEWVPSVSQDHYEGVVERIRELIRAGETYQVNHTFRLDTSLDPTASLDLYEAMLLAQRAAHCAYLDTGRYRVMSASPEMFLRLEGDTLTTRPMKGTAPRGRWPEEDRERADALVASAKERAENAMIVDLLRNDMGRISVPGSVRVPRMFETERYETVWQLTSTIESTLPPDAGLTELMRALFPSGSVTGAPKIRSMEIISELEDSSRGVYTGAVGWVAPAGEPERMVFNVAIRTVEHDTFTGAARFGVGSGITHDSVAAVEYAECLAKTRVLTERRPEFRLFESLRYDSDGWLWLEEHLERLKASATYFDFAYDRSLALAALEAAVSGCDGLPAKVRLTLSRDGAFDTDVSPVAPPPTEPVLLEIEMERRVDSQDVFLFHKTTSREAYTDAAERHPGADDVVFVNERDEVTETTVANLVAFIDGRWLTPAQDCGLLAGTHRRMLLKSGEIAEAHITVDALRNADRIELISSVRMRRPARLRVPGGI